MNGEDRELSDKIVEWGLIAFVFFFPLVYSPVNFDAYALPRLVIVRVVSVFLALFWFIKVFRTRNLKLVGGSVLIPLGLYILVSLLSTINSINPSVSFFGNFFRYEGFFTVVNYVFLLLVAANFGSRLPCLFRLFRAAVASGLLVAIIGIYQYLNSGLSVRAFSTFQNPDFLAYYLILIFPLGISLILLESNLRLKLIWFGVSILSFVCLIVTFTRGAWLGFLVSLVFFGVMVGSYMWRQGRVWIVSFFIFLLISVTAILYLSSNTPIQETSFQRRIASVVQFTGGTAQARVELWRGALRMISQRPVLGWGPDTLSLVYRSYRSASFIQLEGSDVTPDKAHNEFLQLGATIGLFGLAAYLWFLIAIYAIGYSVFTNLRSHNLRMMIAAAMAGGMGYLIALQFLFSEISFTPFFWIVIGLTIAIGHIERPPTSALNLDLNILDRNTKLRSFLLFAALAIVFFLIINNNRILIADFYVRSAKKAAETAVSRQDLSEAGLRSRIYYQRATALNFSNPFYFLSFGGTSFEIGSKLADEKFLIEAIDNFEKAIARNDKIGEAYLGLGDVHFWIARTKGDRQHLNEAEKAYKEVIELDPNRAFASFRLGQIFVEKKQLDVAREYFRKAISLDFRYARVTLNAANDLQNNGKLKEAEMMYNELLKWNPKDPGILNDLAVLFTQTERLDRAIELWNEALSQDSENSDIYFNLGMAYEQKGRDELAIEKYRETLKLDPSDQRAREALQRLEAGQL